MAWGSPEPQGVFCAPTALFPDETAHKPRPRGPGGIPGQRVGGLWAVITPVVSQIAPGLLGVLGDLPLQPILAGGQALEDPVQLLGPVPPGLGQEPDEELREYDRLAPSRRISASLRGTSQEGGRAGGSDSLAAGGSGAAARRLQNPEEPGGPFP